MKAYTLNNYSEGLSDYDLRIISGKNPASYFIVRESNENYGGIEFSKRELATSSANHLSEVSDSVFPTGSTNHLSSLSDSALVARLEGLRGKERKIQLDILLYIIEVEKRKLYLLRGYNSLFEFCTRHLKYSASAAMRRIKASRCIKDFPVIETMLLNGEIDLTSISKIEKIITRENSKDLLREIRNMSTRGVERVVARYSPRENYYDRISSIFLRTNKISGSDKETTGLKETESGKKVTTGAGNGEMDFSSETKAGLNLSCGYKDNKTEPENSKCPTLEEKFKLQFAVDPEFMKRLKQIKSLLSTRYPEGVNLEKLFNIVMEEYLERHSPEKRIQKREKREANKKTRNTNPRNNKRQNKLRSGGNKSENSDNKIPRTYKQRTRNIPAAVRDEVFVRDDGRCAFVGENGKRCNSTWNLEIDHIVPYAKGGDNSPDNLRLLCAKHNLMEAERAYGKDVMEKYIEKK